VVAGKKIGIRKKNVDSKLKRVLLASKGINPLFQEHRTRIRRVKSAKSQPRSKGGNQGWAFGSGIRGYPERWPHQGGVKKTRFKEGEIGKHEGKAESGECRKRTLKYGEKRHAQIRRESLDTPLVKKKGRATKIDAEIVRSRGSNRGPSSRGLDY